jgi:hypothetical protein
LALINVLMALYRETDVVRAALPPMSEAGRPIYGIRSTMTSRADGLRRNVMIACNALATMGLITCDGMRTGWTPGQTYAWSLTDSGRQTIEAYLTDSGGTPPSPRRSGGGSDA